MAAAKASAVKEAVKETLIGSTEEPAKLSAQTKARFTKYAVSDASGELAMGPEEFINAVAPAEEDYVSVEEPRGTCAPLPSLPDPAADHESYNLYFSTRSNASSTQSYSGSPIAKARAK